MTISNHVKTVSISDDVKRDMIKYIDITVLLPD